MNDDPYQVEIDPEHIYWSTDRGWIGMEHDGSVWELDLSGYRVADVPPDAVELLPLLPPLQKAHPALIAQAWHDITCPEGPDCRDRPLHSAAQVLAHTGQLAKFLGRLAELHAEKEIQ